MLHKNMPVDNNHVIHSWAVADAAALAALTPVLADIGKVALQIDTSAYLALANNVGPVWVSLTFPASATAAIAANTADIVTLKTQVKQSISIAASDETTVLTASATKVTFHVPYNFTLSEIIAELVTAQTSGLIFTVDVNVAGSSILSTKLTIDNTEETSITAATPAVISSPAITKGQKITVDIDQIGDGTAKGLKIHLVGKITP